MTATDVPDVSVIIPTLNEAEHLAQTLETALSAASAECIVVDGGSSDGTAELAKAGGARLLRTTAGRARQMNAGAVAAHGDILLFLHGDSRLPEGFDRDALKTLADPATVAGAFKLRIDGSEPGLRLIERVANLRSRYLQIPYGDQAIFLRADLFRSLGGFPDIPIMEDFVFIQRLKREGRVAIASSAAVTSARRWRKLGIFRTTLINQVMLVAYHLRIDPPSLASWYRRQRQSRH